MRQEPIKVVIWGFGAMGSGMAKMILNKRGFDLLGVCDTYENYLGKSIFEIIDKYNPYDHDIIVENDINKILNTHSPEIVLLATDSFTKAAYDKIILLIENGCNVISTAEEMAYPLANNPDLAKKNGCLGQKI